MDPDRRDQLRRKLNQAERHIADGREHIAKQMAIIANLERDAYDSKLAKEFLGILQKTLQMHEDHREHLLRELQG